ncbi:MAG: penicillin-binding transpeptidase domain-containing protein [Brevinema sp.]
MKIFHFIIAPLLVLSSCVSAESTTAVEEEKWIEQAFVNYQLSNEATFVLYDPETDSKMVYNQKRSKERFIPGSTFKFVNATIALSENIVKDIDEVFYEYKGEDVFLAQWTNNMNLRQAFKSSNVPAFQQLAKKIGMSRMNDYITKYEYGNQNIGTIVNSFWLEGPLMISAQGQTKWLAKLASGSLTTPEVLEQIKEISYIENIEDDWKLYGKTGWAKEIGWFVGWIERDDKFLTFAINIDISDYNLLPIRESIAKEILKTYIETVDMPEDEFYSSKNFKNKKSKNTL